MSELIRNAVSNESHNDVNDDSFVTPREQKIACTRQLVTTNAAVWTAHAEEDGDVAWSTMSQKLDSINRFRTYSDSRMERNGWLSCGRRCPPTLSYDDDNI